MALDLAKIKGSWGPRLRLSLRMSWRDIRKHKGRSALIMALIALPVFFMSFAATAGLSIQATPEETVSRELGLTQGRLSPMSVANSKGIQAYTGDIYGGYFNNQPDDPKFVPTPVVDAVPAGYKGLPWYSFGLTSPIDKAQVQVSALAVDALNPSFKGKYSLLEGRAATGEKEALATPGLLERFGKKLGEKLTTSAGDFVLTGTIRVQKQAASDSVLVMRPDQMTDAQLRETSPVMYLVGEKPLRWADARKLNAQGVVLTASSLILSPPSTEEMGADANAISQWDPSLDGGYVSLVTMGLLVGVIALLEVGLLAGAAFAVGTRKQHRDLALLAASGAESGVLKGTVTASGLWLGAIGGVVGAILGTTAAVIGVLVIIGSGRIVFSGLHVFWAAAVVLVIVGVLAGVIAAIVPARAVAKEHSLSALKSGRSASKQSRIGLWVGTGMMVLAAAAMTGSSLWALAVRGTDVSWQVLPLTTALLAAGAVLLILGLIVLSGRLIGVLTKRTAWMPVALRLAARDSNRNRSRTVPAVAAVLAAASLSGALLVTVASVNKQSSDTYGWSFNENQGGVVLQTIDYGQNFGSAPVTANFQAKLFTANVEKLSAAIGNSEVANAHSFVLRGVPDATQCDVDMAAKEQKSGTAGEPISGPGCTRWMVAEAASNRCELAPDYSPKDLEDWRCKGSMRLGGAGYRLPVIVVGGEKELRLLLNRAPSSEALSSLAAGGIVLSNRVFQAPDGTAKVMSYDSNQAVQQPPSAGEPTYMRFTPTALSATQLPAVVDAPDKPLDYYGVISPETAKAMGVPVIDHTLLVSVDRELTAAESDKLQAVVAPHIGSGANLMIETGPQSNMAEVLWLIVAGAGLITLSAAGITAGLALADGRSDQATLASIGADSRLRKSVSASQILMTGALGSALGLIAGALPMVALMFQTRGMPIVVPWLQFGVLLVLVPLFGAVMAWLFTRGNVPMARRQTLA